MNYRDSDCSAWRYRNNSVDLLFSNNLNLQKVIYSAKREKVKMPKFTGYSSVVMIHLLHIRKSEYTFFLLLISNVKMSALALESCDGHFFSNFWHFMKQIIHWLIVGGITGNFWQYLFMATPVFHALQWSISKIKIKINKSSQINKSKVVP